MESLSPIEVEPLLRGRFGRPYLYFERCETTQRLLDASFPEGAVAACEEQTAGRGRLGRGWQAEFGSSILVSLLLRPPPSGRPAELTLLAGLATAIAIERATGIAAQLKWPNDVVVGGHKVSGGIAELRDGAVILGIGINVNQDTHELPSGARLPAASLRSLTGRVQPRAPLLANLLLELEHRYEAWRKGGIATSTAELVPRDYLRGRAVRVDDVSGVAAGIADDGRLELETGSGRLFVESGEVLLGVDVGD